MGRLFNTSILLLILFFGLERFTYYGLKALLPLFLSAHPQMYPVTAESLMKISRIASILAYVLAAVLIDRVKLSRNISLYCIPMVAGLIFIWVGSYTALYTGLTLIIITGTLIKVNVIVKVFDLLTVLERMEGKAYLLMYLIINVCIGLSPLLVGILYRDYNLVGFWWSFYKILQRRAREGAYSCISTNAD
jgi:dipeptide/tripeptide permease